MKSLRIFLGIAFLFHTLYILGADHLRLLPQPQQCVLAKGYFIVGKIIHNIRKKIFKYDIIINNKLILHICYLRHISLNYTLRQHE